MRDPSRFFTCLVPVRVMVYGVFGVSHVRDLSAQIGHVVAPVPPVRAHVPVVPSRSVMLH